MLPRIFRVAKAFADTAISTFHALNDADVLADPNSSYSTIRHTRAWVYYQGVKTIVPISILGREPLPQETNVILQRRGWRTGLLGWTLGGWLRGTIGKELDVTPASTGSWDADVTKKQRAQYTKETSNIRASGVVPTDHLVLASAFVHIPVAAGDGYFRLVVKDQKRETLATTPAFRVGSLSLSSAHPRGASPITLLPELLFKSASLTLTTAIYAGFFAAFPFLKVASLLPGTSYWANWALRRTYAYIGADEKLADLRERYRVDERRAEVETRMYRTVPFGSMGVRTLYDLEEDARLGRGGVFFKRS